MRLLPLLLLMFSFNLLAKTQTISFNQEFYSGDSINLNSYIDLEEDEVVDKVTVFASSIYSHCFLNLRKDGRHYRTLQVQSRGVLPYSFSANAISVELNFTGTCFIENINITI